MDNSKALMQMRKKKRVGGILHLENTNIKGMGFTFTSQNICTVRSQEQFDISGLEKN